MELKHNIKNCVKTQVRAHIECPGGDVHAHHLEDGVERLHRDGAALLGVELVERPLQRPQLIQAINE